MEVICCLDELLSKLLLVGSMQLQGEHKRIPKLITQCNADTKRVWVSFGRQQHCVDSLHTSIVLEIGVDYEGVCGEFFGGETTDLRAVQTGFIVGVGVLLVELVRVVRGEENWGFIFALHTCCIFAMSRQIMIQQYVYLLLRLILLL